MVKRMLDEDIQCIRFTNEAGPNFQSGMIKNVIKGKLLKCAPLLLQFHSQDYLTIANADVLMSDNVPFKLFSRTLKQESARLCSAKGAFVRGGKMSDQELLYKLKARCLI